MSSQWDLSWGRFGRSAALGLAVALVAPVTAAQDAVIEQTIPVEGIVAIEVPAAEPEAKSSTQVLDDVVVTARRRQERNVDVPISLAVLDGETLGNAGLTLATDIQERVAGLIVSMPNARLTSYTIRGLGSSSANDGIESSVGLFLDGVYLGRQGLSMFDLIDLDRVEVLRGPQGTLFGKNTTAGAVNIVTSAPTDSFETRGEITIGDRGARQLRGSINDSLIDGELAGRLTGYLSQRDGIIDNVYDGSTLNDRNKGGLRGQLLWTPSTALSGRFIAEYGDSDENCCVYPLSAPVRRDVQLRDEFMEYTRIGTDPADRVTDSDAPTHSTMRQKAASAEFNWDISDSLRLTSISAYRDWYFLPINDDATSLELASTSTLNDHQQYSQEFRFTHTSDDVDTVFGLFYIHQRLDGLERVILGRDTVGWVFGGVIRGYVPFATESNTGPALYAVIPPESLEGLTVDTSYFQSSDSVAGFASADWHLTDRIDLAAGLRYTYEWKRAAVDRTRYGGDPEASALAAGDPILAILDQALGTDLASLGFNGIIDDVAGGEYERANTYEEGDYSGQLSLSYKLTPDALVYISGARGYKGGGINLGFTGETIKPLFRPEQATSFEAGVKARLFENSWSLALTVYHTDIRDYQALTFDNERTLLANPRQINLLNVGEVRLRGAELEAYGFLAEGLMARIGVAYSDAVTTEFPNAPNEDTRENDKDLSGETLYNAPRWSGNAGLEYSYLFNAGVEAYAGLDYMIRSEYFGTVDHGRSSYIEGYGLGNVRVGLRNNSRSWDVSLWARNALDEDYVATVAPLYGVGDYGAVPGDPLSYGATLRVRWP
ncbi:MAG: TonB-dependent receptor [Pseudomonadota bacterium]|nr:TonB-dependent receptor [Pseudomonadota bacterium]